MAKIVIQLAIHFFCRFWLLQGFKTFSSRLLVVRDSQSSDLCFACKWASQILSRKPVSGQPNSSVKQLGSETGLCLYYIPIYVLLLLYCILGSCYTTAELVLLELQDPASSSNCAVLWKELIVSVTSHYPYRVFRFVSLQKRASNKQNLFSKLEPLPIQNKH